MSDLGREIERIKVPATLPFKAVRPGESQSVEDHSDQVDARELLQALKDSGMAQPERDQIVASYTAARKVIRKYAMDMVIWKANQALASNGPAGPRPKWPVFAAPVGLPGEFADYYAGAAAYHQDKFTEARKCWERLLARPAAERRYRSTWAAFMIGRALMEDQTGPDGQDNSDAAAAWFQKVRELAGADYEDTLGLASASLGWEAKIELDRRHYDKAIHLYLLQYSTGETWAIWSLRAVCRVIEKDLLDLTLRQEPPGVRDSLTRQVMMAYFLAQGGDHGPSPSPNAAATFLRALEQTDLRQIEGADRLAQIAYQAGQMDLARRWTARAKEHAPLAMWINAKLLMRDGKMEEAAPLLAKASALFARGDQVAMPHGTDPETGDERAGTFPADRASAELGILQLSRGQYPQSLDNLIRGGSWLDAAYVAERVLTVEELVKYVDAACPADAAAADPPTDLMWSKAPALRAGLRYLLARRLTRLGRWKEARPYYPPKLRERLDAYIAGIRAGHDAKLHPSERAENLWEAARIARHEGMELLGTELEPDFACVGGDYQNVGPAWGRFSPEQAAHRQLAVVSEDEQSRVSKSAPAPNVRFHYRYIAADHAWAAAELMPDESDETASVLCTAGSWLKDRDKKAAERFYKALVNRCPTTDLGRAAERGRWFP